MEWAVLQKLFRCCRWSTRFGISFQEHFWIDAFYLNFRFWLGESINQSESCRKSLQARPVLFSLFHFSDGQALINIILDFWNFIFHFALLYLLHNYFSAFSPSHIQHKYFLISPMPCTQHSTVWLIYFFIHIKGLGSWKSILILILAISPPILEGFDFMQAELYCCGVENSTDWMNSTIWLNQTMETIT